MNGLTILGIAIIVLVAAYLIYGRFLVKTWGIDMNAETPAVTKEDGVDYVPTSKWVVFTHQFSSIAGAGPVTGPIIAAMFGWLPAFLWIMVGGIFFGAVQDFGALYASVKNKGKSIGGIIEQYIGRTGRKLFFCFCWLFTLLVIAAFSDMVANTFNGFTAEGVKVEPNAAAASISMLFIVVAMLFGLFLKKFKVSDKIQFFVGMILLFAMLALGIAFPMYFSKNVWLYIVFAYIFMASITPMWLLMQPRDYLSSFLLIGMIVAAVIGVAIANPSMNLPAFTGFNVGGKFMFPTLFITVACGAVSGFHSLVSSETSSKQIRNEKDMLVVGYGSMLVECLLAVLALVVVGSMAVGGSMPEGTPFAIFSKGVAGFLATIGLPERIGMCVMTMFVSALALTSLDSVARIGRMSFQEFFEEEEGTEKTPFISLMTNKYFATAITLFFGFVLSLGGYNNIWPLFGASNQLLAALVLIALAVFLKVTGRKGYMLWIPMCVMLVVTFTALGQAVYAICIKLFVTGDFVFLTDGLQLIFAILLMALGLMVTFNSSKKLFGVEKKGKIEKEDIASANN